ncbi:esterase/lipase family protein [Streptomyces clavuligerus]|uniref:DUF676 domain-containing protein n=1 Tax=Streptomyces clavuligerus TaxID=1901 RepID=B5H484_STRCL|nr:hypothetical protein [Streptomyces clavuligerus]ANW19501.1 hypothetical protein BB341_15380 [Streptomyces clavuligerus]AXU14109.1 hypothetical protein D1794_16035 [Streptomyces clavuligerus]EDY53380.1 hypothetical protein SSCG_06408 [Streptomyces clavuligerus]EFG07696.1 Hypothetical protein SCLAV_2624 [Streptomyces clavuligerus]MBY6304095.1 hypothetical protein [Streptomyces clavuligerus]
MSEPTEHEISAALRATPPALLGAGPQEPPAGKPPTPDATWELPGGTAWVYYANPRFGLARPVLIADGFNSGPSTLEFSWAGLETRNYPFISALRERGHDAVLVGFDERSISILQNARTATAAILRAKEERLGGHPLVVGGFSMGGLVTRYALAKMEHEEYDHQTAVYFSYDSPHRGAYIPLSLQAFAHYIRTVDDRFSRQINSTAAQELLWRHLPEWDAPPKVSEQRKHFLAALRDVGDWPRRPRRLGVANGVSTGVGNGVEAGRTAVRGKGIGVIGTDLRTMPVDDDSLAASLRFITSPKQEVHALGLPAADGAPGGTLDSYRILAKQLNRVLGLGVDNPVPEHSFVPTVSAVDLNGLDSDEQLYGAVDALDPGGSGLDAFRCASRNEEHTKVTEELCGWLLDRFA